MNNAKHTSPIFPLEKKEEPANIKIRVLWQLEIETEGPFVHLVDFLDD